VGRQQQVRLASHRTGRDIDHDRNPLPFALGVFERGERVGGFSGLADEQRQPAGLQYRLSVTKLGRDIDVYRDARELLEPIFGDHPRIITGAAGDDRQPLNRRQIETGVGERDFTVEWPHVTLQRLGDHDRLLVNLLLHVVAVITLFDPCSRRARLDDLAIDRLVFTVEDLHALTPNHSPIAFVQISDTLGPRRQRDGVRSEVVLGLAIADGQGRTHPRADDQIGMIAKQEGDGKGALQPRQRGRDRLLRVAAALDLARD